MRFFGGILLIETLAAAACAPSAQKSGQSTPEAAVRAFFRALEENDVTRIRQLMSPQLKDILSQTGEWEFWLSLWRRCSVKEIGHASTDMATSREGHKSVRVPVEYNCPGGMLKDAVSVTLIDGSWYWDEN
jgi:hypothetical protein